MVENNKLTNLRSLYPDAGVWASLDLLEFAGGQKYDVILADPGWTYRDKARAGERGAAYKYNCMTLQNICALPVDALAAKDCLLALWHVPPMPDEALLVMRMWGFKLCTMKGFTWRKLTVKGKEHFGQGHWTRANSEDCLFARRGSPKVVDHSVRQMMNEELGEHSEKPPETRRRLERLIGPAKRIELFARSTADGWDAWGDGLHTATKVNL